MERIINICYITDNNYCNQTYTSIFSLKQNIIYKHKYNIYIICENVKKNNVIYLNSLSNNNFKIHIIEVNNNIFDVNDDSCGRIPSCALYRFMIDKLIPIECDSILYLDSDTIIIKDISLVFNTDIVGKYAAVVKDKINYNGYFNSGVMLFNLKKMRNNLNLFNDLIRIKKENDFTMIDQDVMNIYFKNKVSYINYGYNFLINIYGNTSLEKMKKIYKENIVEKNIKIIHYAGSKKPWNDNYIACKMIYDMYKNNKIDKNKEKKLLKIYTKEILNNV